jgi:hypothetical protein
MVALGQRFYTNTLRNCRNERILVGKLRWSGTGDSTKWGCDTTFLPGKTLRRCFQSLQYERRKMGSPLLRGAFRPMTLFPEQHASVVSIFGR